jgi:uncharacterized hydrophobic protein (TIGR00271 family)
MLGLSVVIALLGLSENSTAVVIGAMLIAPLMTPIQGVSAAIVTAWPSQMARSGLAVMAGSGGAVGLSWAFTVLLPASDKVLTPEVLARTSPDLRDLLIAIAAGTAGAYATAREDVSAALPGVAVAVALVPPLASVGFTLGIGRADLAGGALLLFGVNLIAILLSAALVLLASGLGPSGRPAAIDQGVRAGLAIVVVVTAALSVPLTFESIQRVSRTELSVSVNQAAVTWLAPYPALELAGVTIEGTHVSVEISGPVSPPATDRLTKSLEGIVGRRVALQVRWYHSS